MPYRLPLLLSLILLVAACAHPNGPSSFPGADPGAGGPVSPAVVAMYSARPDGDHTIPAVPRKDLSNAKRRVEVTYWTREPAGTIIVDPGDFHLYYVLGHNKALRYTVSVGKQGYGFSGRATIPFKRKWPRWTPTPNQLKRDPALYSPWRKGMDGGLENPLGARALYLYRDGRDTLYRIHGTPYPETIGKATTDGCIRLFDQDIADLYDRVKPWTRVIVRPIGETGLGTYPPGTPVPHAVLAARAAARARVHAPPAEE